MTRYGFFSLSVSFDDVFFFSLFFFSALFFFFGERGEDKYRPQLISQKELACGVGGITSLNPFFFLYSSEKKQKRKKKTKFNTKRVKKGERDYYCARSLSLFLSLSLRFARYKYARTRTRTRRKKRPFSSSLESEVKKERARRFYLYTTSDRERERDCKEENHVEWTPSPLEQRRVFFCALGRLAPAAKRSEESFEADRVYQPTDFMFFGRFGDGGADDFRREMADEFILGRRRRL